MSAAPPSPAGRCYGLGVGPGDPELITVKALRLLRSCAVVVSFAAANRASNARRVVADQLAPNQDELRLAYPVTTEALPPGVSYDALLSDFYDGSAKLIAEHLDAGRDVAVLCEGDPFFFGSYMYLHTRLQDRYALEVVPGVTSILAGAAVLGLPLVSRNEVFAVLSGVLGEDELVRRLGQCDAAVIMKLGRNLAKVRRAVQRAGLTERAHYVERATMAEQRVSPLGAADPHTAPYFSIVVIPGANLVPDAPAAPAAGPAPT